jgi:MATE family multidrug resistance protein
MSFFTTKSAETSDTILAINTLLFQFFIFFSYFVDGFANAGEALAGRYIGAHDPLHLKLSVRLIFKWALGIALVFTLVYWWGGQVLLKLMTTNQEIIAGAAPYLPWIIAIPVISFVAFIWDGIYIGATVSNHLRNSILVALATFLSVYYIATSYLANHALWLALVVFLFIRGVYLSVFARRVLLARS